MKKIKERTLYFVGYMLILIPISVVSLMTGCLVFGIIIFTIIVFCVKSYVENVKAYRKYKDINARLASLEREDKIELIFRNCDDWLMFASDDEVAELERMFTKIKMIDAGKYELEYILCRAKSFKD